MKANARPRRPAAKGLVLVAVAMVAGVGCSSSPSDALTEEQRTALTEVVDARDRADAVISDVFDVAAVVPRLERWDDRKLRNQEFLSQLRDELPGGACRTAVETLVGAEEEMSSIRRQLIDHYRQEQFGLVAGDTAAYARVKVASGLPAEETVASSCGRSVTDGSAAAGDGAELTAAQNARFDAAVVAAGEASVAYSNAFPVAEFVADVKKMQAADVTVTEKLGEVIALLSDGACRSALTELLDLEQEQAALRSTTISAGEAGDVVEMLTTVGEYSEVNSSSAPYKAAIRQIARSCGVAI